MAIRTKFIDSDTTLNLILSLALLTANAWTATVAEVICTAIEKPNKNLKEIAELLNKSQSNISEALKRGDYEEIRNLIKYYQEQIKSL